MKRLKGNSPKWLADLWRVFCCCCCCCACHFSSFLFFFFLRYNWPYNILYIYIFIYYIFFWGITDNITLYSGFPGGSEGKASAYNVGSLGLIPGSGRSPGEGNGNPLWSSCLEKSHGWRNLVGYSPWGHSQTQLSNFTFTFHNILVSAWTTLCFNICIYCELINTIKSS